MRRVVVVGGGYAGTSVARALDGHAEVLLVEPRERFVHNVAAIRAVADPDFPLDDIIIPYDRLLKRGRVVRGRACEIGEGRVRLDDGRVLDADVVIAATGSTYAMPFKARDSLEDFIAASRAAREDVRRARTISITGAGPVGIELAGEIAVAHPDKKITLFTAALPLLRGYAPAFGRSIEARLESLGVVIRQATPKADLDALDRPGFNRDVAHLRFGAIGARPSPPPIAAAHFSPAGRIAVDGWLRAAGLERVFVLGDAAEIGEPQTIPAGARQAAWLSKLVRRVLEGWPAASLPRYARSTRPLLIVPLGPVEGASILPLRRNGIVVGRRVTAKLKGRDLFVPRFRKEFHAL